MNIILNNCSTKTFSIKPINYKILKNDERIKVYNRQYYLTKKCDGSYYNDKYLSYYKKKKEWVKKYKLGKKPKVPTIYNKKVGEFIIDLN
tara:strand:+ start:1181 stop:1450 length:270 start_codon:yes stop_codon:yes gene_type:complete